jgi:hypothetical protein
LTLISVFSPCLSAINPLDHAFVDQVALARHALALKHQRTRSRMLLRAAVLEREVMKERKLRDLLVLWPNSRSYIRLGID